ncbi:hypothetical protein B7494_g7405 [Chlorociboria aeruginascens]|nr:hypothetical protein B7494_g7405 [Chlorociboria aeruginascens]
MSSNSSVGGYIPFLDITSNLREKRAFHYFQTQTVTELSGFFQSDFWSKIVLQVCHFAPSVLHAVIALGALHESYEVLGHDHPFSKKKGENGQFVLQQSIKAIRCLNDTIATRGLESRASVLISCFLFICLESMQGNNRAALAHLDCGIKVLRHSANVSSPRTHPLSSNAAPDQQLIQEHITALFGTMDSQASSFYNTRPMSFFSLAENTNIKTSLAIPIPPVPHSFRSLTEARACFNTQAVATVQFGKIAQYFSPTADGSEPDIPDDLKRAFLSRGANHILQLEKILHQLNNFLAQKSITMDTNELLASIALKLNHLGLTIVVKAGMFKTETEFDALIPDFGRIVFYVDSLIRLSRSRNGGGKKGHYSCEGGILAPLWYTASRCRDPGIRRKAVELVMISPRREGLWDSMVARALAEWVIAMEEEGLGLVAAARDVTEDQRIVVLNKGFGDEDRCLRVTYQRMNQKRTVRETLIRW